LKSICAVAALMVLGTTNFNPAMADDTAASSGPSCDAGEPVNAAKLSPEFLAARAARFMKLCVASHGALVDDDDSRLIHTLTKPRRLTGPGPLTIVPTMAQHGVEGNVTIYVSYVVETDGRISSGAVLTSSGFKEVDAAAVKWINSVKFESPGYLDFTPVRVFAVMRISIAST
jgi:TonB family protein